MNGTVKKVDVTVGKIGNTADQFNTTATKVNKTADSLTVTVGEYGKLAKSVDALVTENRQTFGKTLTNFNALSVDLRQTVNKLNPTIDKLNGTVAKVEFFQGTTLLGTSTASPYSYTWTNVPAGTYSIVAKAFDALGQRTFSTPVLVTVK